MCEEQIIGRFNQLVRIFVWGKNQHCNRSLNTVGKLRIIFAAFFFLFFFLNRVFAKQSYKTSPRMNWFLLV